MADTKISALTALADPVGTDVVAIVDDPGGTPVTKKMTMAVLSSFVLGNIIEKSSDPSDPSEGAAVIWMSDGTGTGDDGDVLIKVTAGGATKTVTLVDFSAVP